MTSDTQEAHTRVFPERIDAIIRSAAFRTWLDAHQLHAVDVSRASMLQGGTQNILVCLPSVEGDLVLRHPPLHKRAGSDETLRREVRTLRLLQPYAVPHPRLRAASEDAERFGSVLYLMDKVEGFNPASGLPDAYAMHPDWQHALGLSMVQALAQLAEVPVQAALAANFRDATGWLPRQPDRWLAHLGEMGETALLAPGKEIRAWLAQRVPREWEGGLIHGDYHLGNVLMSHQRPEVSAVIDWELATLGCPLLDLAHFVVGWPVANPASPFAHLDAPHLTPARDLVAHYVALRGRQISDLNWFGVLACFRLGALLEGTHVRARAGQADAVVGRRLHGIATHMFEKAFELMAGPGLDSLLP